jgi:hypothetical protein
MVGTGGNSLAQAIAAFEPCYKLVQLTEGVAGVVCGDTEPLNFADGRTLFYGHNLCGLVEKAGMNDRYMTILRNPLDRLISDFFWTVGHVAGMSAYKAMELFTEFVDNSDHLEFYIHHCGPLNFNNSQHFKYDECSTVSNSKADVMARDRLEERFWMIGITELFDETLFFVADTVGINKISSWWHYRHIKTRFRPNYMDLSKSLRNQIEKKTLFDMTLYEDYRKKFETQFNEKECGDAFISYFNKAHPCEMK